MTRLDNQCNTDDAKDLLQDVAVFLAEEDLVDVNT